jgi:methionine biosynthesis protein MetW
MQDKSADNFYDIYWTKRNDKSNRYRYKIFLSWIKDGSRVLDIGSGDGYLGALLKNNKNCDVTCLDISEVALDRAKNKGLNTVLANIEESLPFEDNAFDYVIASEVIEHIAHSERLLTEMKRISRNFLLVSIPNTAFWKYRLQLLGGKFPKQWAFEPYEHLRYWSVSDFKRTLSLLALSADEIRAGSGRRYLRDIWPSLFAEQVCFKISKSDV